MKIIFFTLLVSSCLIARAMGAVDIKSVIVNCEGSKCEDFKDRFVYLEGTYVSEDDLKEKINIISSDKEIESINYSIAQQSEVLTLDLKLNKFISDIKFNINHDVKFDIDSFKDSILIKSMSYFNKVDNEKSLELIKRTLADRGYENIEINFRVTIEKKKYVLNYDIIVEYPTTVGKIETSCDIPSLCESLVKRIDAKLLNKPFKALEVSEYLTNENSILSAKGHIFSQYQLNKSNISEKSVLLQIRFKIGDSYKFFFEGNKIYSFQELKQIIVDILSKNYKTVSDNALLGRLKLEYEKKGYYKTNIKVSYRKNIIDKETGTFNHFYIFKIDEGSKTKLKEISFQGNNKLVLNFEDLFYEKAPILVKRGFFLKEYIESFQGILKNSYYEKGFIFAEISPPVLRYQEDGSVKIFYKITEGEQTEINSIKFIGVPIEIEEDLRKEILNKEGAPLNVFNIRKDIDLIESRLKSLGYYYSRVENKKPDQHLFYNFDYKLVDIKYEIFLDEKIFLNDVIITGNDLTKKVVIRREVYLNSMDIVTPADVTKITEHISNLGIFSDVNVDLLRDSQNKNMVNLLINVKEKDSGIVELAPGYRTDLGAKLSFGIGHNNMMGMNRTLSFKGQANQRFDLNRFNQQRNQSLNRKIEYQTNVNFAEPYLLGFPLSSLTTAGFSSRRYYKYDAEALKIKTQLSKDFGEVFSTSIFYQLESIKVRGSNDAEDNGYFRIGAVSPGVTLDLRDDAIYPKKGAFFDLSYEYSHPNLYSQNRSDYEISYDKAISYNNFYYPLFDGVLAISYSFGVQRDLVKDVNKRQRIPKFKVFRLNGIDMVRGFKDEEINKLETGEDINDVKVDNVAYFSNFKLEPRFYWDDSIMIGPFFDAGRLFVNHFRPLDLRYSVGFSIKFLTPVGPIDLSYGFKPYRYPGEDFGQFTISVGPF